MCTHVHFRVTTQSDKMTCGRGFANSFLGAIPDYFGSRATTITLMELSKSGSHNLFYNSLCQFVHTIGTRDRQLHCIGCRKGVHGTIHFSIILQNQRASPSQQRCAIIATCFSQPPLTLSPESQWDLDERGCVALRIHGNSTLPQNSPT